MALRFASNRHQSSNKPQHKKTSSHRASSRAQSLADLLPLWDEELHDTSFAGRLKVLVKLRRALRIERRNGTNGHWTYDLARHKALLDAYRREVASVSRQKNQAGLSRYARSQKTNEID